MTEFTKLVRELHKRSDEAIFDQEFAFTGYEGIRYYPAGWLVEDILSDGIEKGSQEYFEELFDLFEAVMTDEDYFGGEFPFMEVV